MKTKPSRLSHSNFQSKIYKNKFWYIAVLLLLFYVLVFHNTSLAATTPKITCGSGDTIALKSDGTVWTWGTTPTQVSGLSDITAIASGWSHKIALRSDGTVWTWGDNYYGQLGDGTNTDRTTPVQVSGLSGVTAIVGGGDHTIALKSDGTVWTWGWNSNGQLGDGTNTDRTTPVQVNGLSGVTAIASGYKHTIALKSGGTVWAWGTNGWGELGNGTYTERKIPIQVNGLSSVIAIAGGFSYTIALKSDGTVWTWGLNNFGQLGDETTTIMRATPIQVSGISDVTAIAGGYAHTIALKSDGTVWAWGYNYYGQLGDGTNTKMSTTPVQVSGLSDVIAIAGGYAHTIALKSDGTVWAWGQNDSGQLGDGTSTNRTTPVQVSGINLYTSTVTTPTPIPTPTPSDIMVPSGSISINSGASYTNSTTVTINLTATDNVGVTGYYLSDSSTTPSASDSGWTSVASTTSYSGSGSYTLSSNEGSKIIYVWYKDAAGNVSSTASATIILDTTVPTVTITSPTTNSTYTATSSTIDLGGNASDSSSGISVVTWSNSKGGNGTANGTASWTVSGISLSSGDNTITVTARDGAGNSGTDTITVTYNAGNAPTVTTGSASNVTSTSAYLSGTVNPNGLSTTMWFEYGTTSGSYSNTTSAGRIDSGSSATRIITTISGLSAGTTYYYRIAARNSGGASYGSEASFTTINAVATPTPTPTTDTKAPTNVSVSINSGDAYTNSSTITLNLSATDNLGVTGYFISDISSTPSASTSGWTSVTSINSYSGTVSYSLSGDEGSKTIYVWYKDAAGNVSNTASATITLDTTAPIVNITSPTSSTTYTTTSSTISLGGSASDSTSGVSTVNWSNSSNSTSGTVNGTTTWITSSITLSNGNNIVTVTATDGAGNNGTDTITVKYTSGTTTPNPSPTPTLLPLPSPSPAVSPSPPNEGIVFGFVYDENDNSLKGVTVTIAGNNFSDSTETESNGYYEFDELAEGDYTLTYEKEGYETQTINISLEKETVFVVDDVTMEEIEKGKIYGYVVKINGDPIESVRLRLKGIKTKVSKNTSSDADGFFEFTGLGADTYVILAKKRGYKKTKQIVKLGDAESQEIEIEMRKTSKRVIDERQTTEGGGKQEDEGERRKAEGWKQGTMCLSKF